MTEAVEFRLVTVGWIEGLIEDLWDPIAARGNERISHILHPSYTSAQRENRRSRPDVYFFRDDLRQRMPAADHQLLASLEQEGVPTIHNMIMSDRIVSKLRYADALSYATFLAQRLLDLFQEIRPSVIIGAFDGLHGSIAQAVAKRMHIPWFALHFTVIPPSLVCFCDRMSPAARVSLRARPADEFRPLAETSLQQFESRKIQAVAYIAPLSSIGNSILKAPARLLSALRMIRRARQRDFLQFTEDRTGYSIGAVLLYFYRRMLARNAISKVRTLAEYPATPYVLFGLHMQPESSIDVWAPFFSNQMWVIELLARSIPPTHKLLVKIHKSDTANHSRAQLERMCALPGVELVRPFADTRSFIENADLVVTIQGTMGLEAALLGKQVITLDESPFSVFPTVSRMGEIVDLPKLIRSKLTATIPGRDAIIAAYAAYLSPFFQGSSNNWTVKRTGEEIDGYVELLKALRQHLTTHGAGVRMHSIEHN